MSENKESRRKFFQKTAATSLGLIVSPALMNADEKTNAPVAPNLAVTQEWRNKQPGMSYRQLGRSGMMVSEMIFGTTPWDNTSYIKAIEIGVEKGINYIDTAAVYSKGESEKVIGRYLSQPGNRQKVFVSTKLSHYDEYMNNIVKEIMKGLPQKKQEELRKKADDLIQERGILKPGYHFTYFPNQARKFNSTYLKYFVLKEYGYKREWKAKIKAHAHQLFEKSLKSLQTDHVDVLYCPHGLAMPEMLDDENIREVFDELKQKGAVRNAAVSFHNDVTANLAKTIDVGYYDVAMFAYNIANHAGLETLIHKANKTGMGIIAMKVARIIHADDIPQWRLDKLNDAIPDKNLTKYAKAYLWALQNPNITCCVAEMSTKEIIEDNVSIVGRKVDIGKL